MQYDPPCKKMTLSSNAIIGQNLFAGGSNTLEMEQLIELHIWYKVDDYEEVINERLFTIESLFGQVGGFIGIMLGVSFPHIPEILLAALAIFRNKFMQSCRGEVTTLTEPLPNVSQSTQQEARLQSGRANSYSSVSYAFKIGLNAPSFSIVPGCCNLNVYLFFQDGHQVAARGSEGLQLGFARLESEFMAMHSKFTKVENKNRELERIINHMKISN